MGVSSFIKPLHTQEGLIGRTVLMTMIINIITVKDITNINITTMAMMTKVIINNSGRKARRRHHEYDKHD